MAETTTQPKKQTMRYSDAELSVMKNSFAENDAFFLAVRKLLLQFPLTKTDADIIKGVLVGKPATFAILSKTFNPKLDTDAPFTQMIDLWMTFEIKDKVAEQVMPTIYARDIVINYLDQQLIALSCVGTDTKPETTIDFDSLSVIKGKDDTQVFIDLIARNTLISHIEQQCNQLLLLAGRTEETPEQTRDRLAKDSNK